MITLNTDNMSNRRDFLKKSAMGTTLLGPSLVLEACANPESASSGTSSGAADKPLVISTWNNVKANDAAWAVLDRNGNALDAVEAGAKVPEADPNDRSVGYGGRPDRDGRVTLDACIMNSGGDCGSVVFLEHIKHPISVARKVMEDTPHVILAGEGALKFALESGFKKEDLLTEASKNEWQEWLKTADYKPVINIENHDTIGILALDNAGDIAGACTTSGAAYKMRGRVGDSPIIGSGLYVDNEVGGAAATGLGEKVIKVVGSYLVVELMRQGNSPADACRMAIERIKNKNPDFKDFQVGFVALNKNGEYGGYSLHDGFGFALHRAEGKDYFKAESLL